MQVFQNYAHYYDLLYEDKDYRSEIYFLHRLIEDYLPETKTILDLGCGTGKHAILFAQKGYEVHGIDFSVEMLKTANQQLAKLNAQQASLLKFSHGDIRNIRLDQTFDIVLSLFHVISYQTTNEDVLATLTTAREHLNPGGILIFDVWYGPAVLTQRPAVRIKRLEDRKIAVTRIAEPQMYPNENLVDVNYQIFIKNKADKTIDELQETHQLRYFFEPEIDLFFSHLSLKKLVCKEWLTDNLPSFNTWGVYFVAQA
jgi:SAM-dependent methyltransferase